MLVLYMPRLPMGGIERATVALANHWAAAGRHVTVLLDRREGELVDALSPDVPLAILGAARTASALPPLVLWLRRTRPEALLSALPHNSLVALAAGRMTGTRVTVAEHSLLRDKMRLDPGVRRILPLMRRFYPGAASVMTPSQAVADDLAAIAGLRRPIRVVGNPVVPDGFAPGAFSMPPDMPSDGAPVFLAIGRLAPIKDFPTLLTAFRTVLDRRAAHLVILGDGPERRRLEALAQTLAIGSRFRLPGNVGSPWPYLTHASALVVSSLSEGFGNTIVEAMACGTQVVATRCGGPEELLRGGALGPIAPVGDATALGEAMLCALKRPIDPGRLRQAVSAFTVSAVAGRYIDAIFRDEQQ